MQSWFLITGPDLVNPDRLSREGGKNNSLSKMCRTLETEDTTFELLTLQTLIVLIHFLVSRFVGKENNKREEESESW